MNPDACAQFRKGGFLIALFNEKLFGGSIYEIRVKNHIHSHKLLNCFFVKVYYTIFFVFILLFANKYIIKKFYKIYIDKF